MIRPLVTYPDDVLAGKAKKIEEITPELLELIEDMVETMYEGDGVGLAAPQVGQPIRLITLDPSGPKERTQLMVLINPEIVSCEGSVSSEEGCLSVPGFSCKVKRHEKVTVKAQDKTGKDVCIEADDFLAIVLQHEIDHLEGTIILDHAGRLKRAMYEKKLKKWEKQSNRIG